MKRQSQQGIALVITLILLSVITFMTVTFLVVSRHESEQVDTTTQQNVAKFAADGIEQQAVGQIIALMQGQTNGYNFALLVSTNYVSPFYDNSGTPAQLAALTNVNYYDRFGVPISGALLPQMLNNLLYPRAPVFISTNKNQLNPEFRFYHDLNGNGRFDTNGFITNLDNLGQMITNGGGGFITSIQVGDPEWVGFLEHPDQRHSASNFFLSRGAFIAIPIGNTLDINFIHNQAKLPTTASFDGYLRNQGVGSWEINLAAFLHTLNTNWDFNGVTYSYNTNNTGISQGTSFSDAASIVQYRYNGGYNRLNTFRLLYPPNAQATPGFLFINNYYIDGYSAGPLMTGTGPLFSTAQPINAAWSGADNPIELVSPRDLMTLIPGQSPLNSFTNHLYSVGTNLDTYNRYTFYRMLAQMGVGSAPEPSPYPASRKINLNYLNINGVGATNFLPWTPVQFFTNAANSLLRLYYPSNFTILLNGVPVQTNININFIPIYPTNYYTPAVHRLLQLAANIYDAGTNKATSAPNDFDYPSVFRPVFNKSGTTAFINGYMEENTTMKSYNSPPLSLQDQGAQIGAATVNVYGIPWVIGAKKNLPNLNEISMMSVSQVTRRLQIDKIAAGTPRSAWHTNIQYIVGISNLLGLEVWNSYSNKVARSINIIAVDNFASSITNEFGLSTTNLTIAATNYFMGGPILTSTWPGFANRSSSPALNALSFQIPIYTNIIVQPDSVYRQSTATLIPANATNGIVQFETSVNNPQPHFVYGVTNRLRFIMLDQASQRVIDYVQLDGMNDVRDLTAELPNNDNGVAGVWDLSRVTAGSTGPINGVINQTQVSAGAVAISTQDWNNNSLQPYTTTTTSEISKFRTFVNTPAAATNLTAQAPFTPTRKAFKVATWQANDPLVHYTLSDLTPSIPSNTISYVQPPNGTQTNLSLVNIGAVNDRYSPWGGNPQKTTDTNAYVTGLKDPGMLTSDNWQFPTNKFPNIGWLGRVHRGTPWQTVYLKSSGVNSNAWQSWTGNSNSFDAAISQPTNDWQMLDLFTTSPNDNASRGQLSVNQTNLAAWAAILDGVFVLSNSPAGLVATNIDPAQMFNGTQTNIVQYIVSRINAQRASLPGGVFSSMGQILSTPELTVASPYLNTNNIADTNLTDAVYERIPQQIMSLLRLGSPRYAIYAYGQALKPADRSILQSGSFFGMCTNYQITGEVLTRTIVRFDNAPTIPIPGQPPASPRAVVESFQILPPDQ